jgi:tetratricopeptide (TPR) repeat protein
LADLITRIDQGTTRATSDRKLIDELEDTRSSLDGTTIDRVEARYAKAFNGAGFTVDTTSPAEVARAIAGRPAAVVTSLIAHLDYWTHVRRSVPPPPNDLEWWRHPLAVVRALDTDPWRNELRDAWGRGDRETYVRLSHAPDLDSRPPESLCLLGILLTGGPGSEHGLDVLQQAQVRYPNDFWTNMELANAYQACQPPRLLEASRYLAAATALRPNSAGARYRLGYCLHGARDYRGAEIALQGAVRLNPTHAHTFAVLGGFHLTRGELDSAMGRLREALRIEPDDMHARDFLGLCQLARTVKSERVLGLLQGRHAPQNGNERLTFAALCAARHDLLSAARLYAETLKEQPALCDDRALQNRFRAAQCAARIAGSTTVDEATKTQWRRQAREWLNAELLVWSNTISTGAASDRSQAAAALHDWKTIVELEAVRGPQFLNKLTKEESASWLSLWAEVDRLCKIADSKASSDGL